jgi:hypothetical protein
MLVPKPGLGIPYRPRIHENLFPTPFEQLDEED